MKDTYICYRPLCNLFVLFKITIAASLLCAQSIQVSNDTAKGATEVAVGPKVFVPDQAKATFSAAWKEFRETHSYNLDGEFEPGGSCEDNHDTLDAFYIYLTKHRITKTIHFQQRCSLCSGSGKIQPPGEGITGNNNCPNCRGSGREEAANTYTFLVLENNAPAKPETPRQKQEKALRANVTSEMLDLETRHAAGDLSASLRLGKIFSEGYHFIPKDISRSESYFLKAATLGSEAGLAGYLKAKEEAFKGNHNDAVIVYALRLSVNPGTPAMPPATISYTNHLVAQAISDRIGTLLRQKRIKEEDFRLSKLRDIARSPNGNEPLVNPRTPQANALIREFLSNERPPRITSASLSKLRHMATSRVKGSFGMLADFCLDGEGPNSLRNAQAAHIYYRLEYLTSGDHYALECAHNIETSIDLATTEFFLNEYRRLLAESGINENTLLAIDEIHPNVELSK